MFQVVVAAAKLKGGELKINIKALGGRFEGADAFRHDFGADAVTGDNGNTVGHSGSLSC